MFLMNHVENKNELENGNTDGCRAAASVMNESSRLSLTFPYTLNINEKPAPTTFRSTIQITGLYSLPRIFMLRATVRWRGSAQRAVEFALETAELEGQNSYVALSGFTLRRNTVFRGTDANILARV